MILKYEACPRKKFDRIQKEKKRKEFVLILLRTLDDEVTSWTGGR